MVTKGTKQARKLRTLSGSVHTVASEEDWLKLVHSTDDKLPGYQNTSAFKQLMQKLARAPEYRNVRFVRADVTKLNELARRNGIVRVPTFACYRNGIRLESATLLAPQKIVDMLERHKRKESGNSQRRLPAFLAAVASIAVSAFAAAHFASNRGTTSRSAETASTATESDVFADEGEDLGGAEQLVAEQQLDQEDSSKSQKSSKRRQRQRESSAPTTSQGMIAPRKKSLGGPSAAAKRADEGEVHEDEDDAASPSFY